MLSSPAANSCAASTAAASLIFSPSGRCERRVEGKKRLHHFCVCSTVRRSRLVNAGSSLGCKQFEKTCFVGRYLSGKIRVDLTVLNRERLTQSLDGFFIKSHRRQHVCEFVSQRRKLSILARESHRAFCVQRRCWASNERASAIWAHVYRDSTSTAFRASSEAFS